MVVTLGLGAAVLTGVGQSNTPTADAAPAGPIEDAKFDRESLKGRIPGSAGPIPEGHVRNKLHVKFTPESGVRIRKGRVSASPGKDGAALHAALQRIGGVEVVAVDDRPADQVIAERTARERAASEPLPDLSLWHEVNAPEERIGEVLGLLNASDLVELAYAPTVLVAPADPRRAQQVHRRSATPGPGLLDVEAAHTVPGGRGERVGVTDLEIDNFNLCHEDLAGRVARNEITRLPNTPASACNRELDSHGTGAVGYIAAEEDNNLGMTGIAPRARIRLGSLNEDTRQDQYGDNTPTMVTAINASQPGDVILLEIASPNKGPIEVNTLWQDIILTATKAGIIVVEPAGNDPVNVDEHWRSLNPTKPTYADSGAIMVGGGIAPAIPNHTVDFCRSQSTERAPDSSSAYGLRVDVQAWFWCGATLGTGSTDYNPNYGGTSGASAMIAGTVASLSSVVEERTGLPLNPYIARSLLKVNGRPQRPGDYLPDSGGVLRWNATAPTRRNVGPAPDLGQTIANLDGTVSAGATHTLAARADGTVWAWGGNTDGQLGHPTSSTITTTTPSQVPALSGVLPTKGALATGASHSVALRADGKVYTWGRGTSGELGRGTTTSSPTPAVVSTLADVVQVSATGNFTLALKGDGTVWGWGDNSNGQLGDGTTTARSTPVKVANLTDVVAISAGYLHSVAVTRDGKVWAWGNNVAGQLGDGTTTQRTTPIVSRFAPAKAAPNSIAAGVFHTLSVKVDGTVQASGWNTVGQLGDGTTVNKTSPVTVSGLTGVTSVAVGSEASYALVNGTVRAWGTNGSRQLGEPTVTSRTTPGPAIAGLAGVTDLESGANHAATVGANGTVSTWGFNDAGQVGNGTRVNAAAPYVIPGVEGRAAMAAVAGGGAHSVAVRADGSVWTWGSNSSKQLGVDNVTARSAAGRLIHTQLNDVVISPITIAAGDSHSVVVRKDGTVWAWGANNVGQLGNPSTVATSATPLQVTGLSGIVAVSAQGNFTLALRQDGTVWAWGANGDRTLGNTATTGTFSRTAVQVTGPTAVKAIAAGYTHSLAVTDAGAVWTWGNNAYGQLGDGGTAARTAPRAVTGLADVSAVPGGAAAGFAHSLVVKRDGSVWAWGLNASGQLGTGSTANASAPVKLTGVSGVRTVSAQLFAGHARRTNGDVWAWGANAEGNLGDGTTTNRPAPVALANVKGMIAVVGGHSHAAAIGFDGTLRTWGNNGSGRVGVASPTVVTSPVSPTGLATLRPKPTA